MNHKWRKNKVNTEVEHFLSKRIYTYLNPSWTTHCLSKNPIDFLSIFFCNVVWKQVLNLRFFPGQQTNTFSLTVTFNELLIPDILVFLELLNPLRLYIEIFLEEEIFTLISKLNSLLFIEGK